MKFLILYGPPAVGKLTTAQEIANLTGFKVFHNHLSVDIVKSLYDFHDPKFWDLVRAVRQMFIESAAKDGIDTIFTYVYTADESDEHIAHYMDIVEQNGGEVLLVRMTTNRETLLKRVEEESRKKFQKIADPQSLDGWLVKYKLFESIPGRESVTIDNTNLSAHDAAKKIIAHFNIPLLDKKS